MDESYLHKHEHGRTILNSPVNSRARSEEVTSVKKWTRERERERIVTVRYSKERHPVNRTIP